MADSRALIFIALVILFGLAIITLAQRTNQTAGNPVGPSPTAIINPTATRQASPTLGVSPTSQPVSQWMTYRATNHDFSIRHPQAVNIDLQGDNSVLLWQFGPSQQQNTEFYDGIALAINSGTYNNRSLQEIVQAQIDELENNPTTESVSQAVAVRVANLNGLSFSVESGGIRNYIFLPGASGKYLMIINSTQDPSGWGFDETVNQILASLRIL